MESRAWTGKVNSARLVLELHKEQIMALTTPDPTFYPLFLLVIPPPIGGSFDWTEGRLAVGVNPCPWPNHLGIPTRSELYDCQQFLSRKKLGMRLKATARQVQKEISFATSDSVCR